MAARPKERNENLYRCFSCHKSQAQQDFVFTRASDESAN